MREAAKDKKIDNLTRKLAEVCSVQGGTVSKENDKRLRISALDKLKGAGTSLDNNEWKKLLIAHLESLKFTIRPSRYDLFIIPPKTAKQSPVGMLTFAVDGMKYTFEREFAVKKRNKETPLQCQRPQPQYHPSSLPKDDEIRRNILKHFNDTLTDQGFGAWCLSSEGTEKAAKDLKVYKKDTKKNPSVFYEFFDPTSHCAWVHYWIGHNPFANFDFKEKVPNPHTRDQAKQTKELGKVYGRRFPGGEDDKWHTLDKEGGKWW